MKRHWEEIVAMLALALGMASMASTLFTDEYARAAVAEARGYQALTHSMEARHCEQGALSGHSQLAANEAFQ